MKGILTCVIALYASSAIAGINDFPKHIEAKCNENGAVLSVSTGETIYMGKSCDTYIPGIGKGSWWSAASSFTVSVGDYEAMFREDLPCALTYCRPNQ